MKCKTGFKEKNGKCIKEHIDTYCDTNILLAFINRDDLENKFGNRGLKGYPNIYGGKDNNTEIKLRNLKKCRISREALMNDLKGNQASMGGVLTSINLKEVDVVDVGGFKRGKKLFKNACLSNIPDLKRFRENFCRNRKLRKNLRRNQIEDIRHIGASMELGSKEFLTGDKDLISLNKNKEAIESYLN